MAVPRYPICWLATSLRLALGVAGALSPAVFAAPPAAAQDSAAQQRSVAVPGFWDPRRRPERPDLSRLQTIRFLTETDYPPFDYAGPDGNPAGFNVDLARLLCDEIKVTCTIQARRFDTLLDALNDNRGDAVIASIAPTAETRQRADFTDPYYRTPARFVARTDSPHRRRAAGTARGQEDRGRRRHRARSLSQADVHRSRGAALSQRRRRARGVAQQAKSICCSATASRSPFWLNGTDSGGCCAFRGGPFLDSRFFGEGVGIAVKRGNDLLRQALNWALFRQWEKGSYTDLWLRYFPISPF